MRKKFCLLLLVFLGLPSLAVANREICGSPPPEQFREENNESIKGDLNSKANFLSGFVGKAELGGKIEATRKEILAKYSDANVAYMDRYLVYMFCFVLFDPTNTQTSPDKIKAIQEFKRQQQQPQSLHPPSDPGSKQKSSAPAEKPEKGEHLRVWANSVEGVSYLNKTGGYAQVNFEARGTWLAIPEDLSNPDIPKTAKGYISPNGDPNFQSNVTPCRVPLGALIVIGKDGQCKPAYGGKGSFELVPGETIYFLMNDVSKLYKDNEGYVDVQLSISKK